MREKYGKQRKGLKREERWVKPRRGNRIAERKVENGYKEQKV